MTFKIWLEWESLEFNAPFVQHHIIFSRNWYNKTEHQDLMWWTASDSHCTNSRSNDPLKAWTASLSSASWSGAVWIEHFQISTRREKTEEKWSFWCYHKYCDIHRKWSLQTKVWKIKITGSVSSPWVTLSLSLVVWMASRYLKIHDSKYWRIKQK